MTRLLTLVACVAVAAVGCAPAEEMAATPPDTSADVAAINALSEREMAAFSAVDTAALAEIFASDVLTMPPNEPAMHSLAEVQEWATTMASMYSVSASYDSSDVIVSGDLAVQTLTGTLTMTPVDGGDAITDNLKAIHILRKQADGSWRITQDIWNSSNPPMAAGGQ